MGKRSDFKRVERDFYPTPKAAVLPLLPHLSTHETIDEPCAGNGALVDVLEKYGYDVAAMSDIEPQESRINEMDAMQIELCEADIFVTNPPYKWEVLSPLITHLSGIAPCWMLLPADMMHNKRMGPHMKDCAKVVSVGRVKWFGNQAGMENSAWFLFDGEFSGVTKFYGRATK